MFDILYSVGCHEHPDGFLDFLRNVFYYNKACTVGVVVNCNVYMYTALKDRIGEIPNVYILPTPWDKTLYTYDIVKTHVQNFEYCKTAELSATYFIPLSSNCMFHKQVSIDSITSLCGKKHDTSLKTCTHTGWLWPIFLQNKNIVAQLNRDGIYNYAVIQHEGIILQFPIMGKIVSYLRENTIQQKASRDTVFEEILLGTLHAHFTGYMPPLLCKVFWDKPGYRPTITEIEDTSEPCVKRVQRTYDDPVREWLRERANGY
jgi:hypothetical protein